MNFKPTISVVIPTYNRSEEIVRAIKSVLAQIYLPTEIWIIDDCSEEDILGVVNQFNDARIKYRRLDKKVNANVARNLGANLSTSQFIAFLDSDDEWKCNHLSDFLENYDPIYDGYFSSAQIQRDKNLPPTDKLSRSLEDFDSPLDFLLDGGFAQTSSFIISKSAFSHCAFDEGLKRHQDYDFFIRFYQSFKWKQLNHYSVIIHWEVGRVVTRDYLSEMIFIKRNRDIISPRVYKRYIRIQYDYFYSIGQLDALPVYQAELKYISKYLSISEFRSFYKERPDNIKTKLMLTFRYLLMRAIH